MEIKRSYSHKELAISLFPEYTIPSASKALSCWIQRDPELLEALFKSGYKKRQRIFTPRQVGILIHFLWEPNL